MDKKIGLFWLRDDFRLSKNYGLIEATLNHDEVVAFYLYKKNTYHNQEAQKWWLSKSLYNFKQKLSNLNINLEIIETASFKVFFEKLLKKNDFAIYWNKVYEPDFLKFDDYIQKALMSKNISYKIFKGNALNEIN
jgi:deoxyribodipyrimidine photolyase